MRNFKSRKMQMKAKTQGNTSQLLLSVTFQIDFSCSGPNHIEPCNIEEKASCFIKEKSFRSRESVFVSKSDNEFPERLIFSWRYILFLKQSDRSFYDKGKEIKNFVLIFLLRLNFRSHFLINYVSNWDATDGRKENFSLDLT